MDRNTITGILLIFAIFIGFSIYNNNRNNKAYEKMIVSADSLYRNGHLEDARTVYMTAMRLKPNPPDIILRLTKSIQNSELPSNETKADSTTSVKAASLAGKQPEGRD